MIEKSKKESKDDRTKCRGLSHKCHEFTWIFWSNFSAIIFCCAPLKDSDFIIALPTIIAVDGESAFPYIQTRKTKGYINRSRTFQRKQNRAVLRTWKQANMPKAGEDARASCQVPQELEMLVSSALLSRICLHNSNIKQSTYMFLEAWIKGNIRSAISVRSVQPQFFVHLWMLEERNNQGCAPSQKADCFDSCKIWNLLCWILKLDPIPQNEWDFCSD